MSTLDEDSNCLSVVAGHHYGNRGVNSSATLTGQQKPKSDRRSL